MRLAGVDTSQCFEKCAAVRYSCPTSLSTKPSVSEDDRRDGRALINGKQMAKLLWLQAHALKRCAAMQYFWGCPTSRTLSREWLYLPQKV